MSFQHVVWRVFSHRAKGVIFVPASGRSKAGMFSCMGELGEDLKKDGSPFLCMNGLTVSTAFFSGVPGAQHFRGHGLDLGGELCEKQQQ